MVDESVQTGTEAAPFHSQVPFHEGVETTHVNVGGVWKSLSGFGMNPMSQVGVTDVCSARAGLLKFTLCCCHMDGKSGQ